MTAKQYKPLSENLASEARSLIRRYEHKRVLAIVLKDFEENMPSNDDERVQESARVKYCQKVILFYRQAAKV